MQNKLGLQKGRAAEQTPRKRRVSVTDMRRIVVWAVSDGRAGMENQVLGIAEAIQRRIPASIVTKRIEIDPKFENLPHFMWGNPFERLTEDSDKLTAPWPDVFIGCGRRVVPFAKALKQHCFTVQTQDPRSNPEHFGLVVPPAHDRLKGKGVMPIQGSPNRLSKERLKLEGQLLNMSLPRDIQFKTPYCAALIGGPSKAYRWNSAAEDAIVGGIAAAIQAGHFVLATTSRRTPQSFVERLRYSFKPSKLWLWDGEPVGPIDNPYFGMLGLAERILVTEESANMITEAAFTGKPVHLLPLPGGGAKWRRFHEGLVARGVLRPNATLGETWTYPPLRETDRVADEIVKKLTLRGVIEPGA
ncbi:mitochondrial fission ELM1 family protein [Parvularcula lutaonensis]|uniref:Mitochondrial fission ELM1 family protein n=1 Tax=Parvularcula lutaonensis TaxID=491923 RepID=A0ABV7MED9_9PROT|nr:mitochondrial fission ELM1 family protein [Parvularcula lutaonensis]GGY51424.1 nucleoside-diphosphate sugar epimerase [Parvularcula lutaonensis]